jgi:hypothetical protein
MAILFLATIMGSLGAAEDVLEPGVPEVPENPDGTGTTFIPVETPPPQPEPYNPLAMFNPLLLLVIILVIGALAAYVPGEVQRMRIETAFRESMDARLALAKGDFTVALAGFDRAIDQAHQAYTRRTRVNRPAEWKLLPDEFYIGLWRGRASALFGLGRTKSASATTRLADELEAVVNNGRN